MIQPNPNQKRLLALDGGGLMGLVSLGILQRMEDQLCAAHGNDPAFRLRDFFDYIAGTSTGAIIAAGLMTGRSVAEIRNIYVNHGDAMFSRVSLLRRMWSLFSHKYPRKAIVQTLQREFTGQTILALQESGQLPSDKHLLMIMHNLSTDSCWPVSTNPAAKYNKLDHPNCNLRLPLWQLIRASTAAPTYFLPEEVDLGGRVFVFQDGGLTAHNNPAMKLFQMATDPHYRLGWPTGEDRLMLVSVGTGVEIEPIISRFRSGMPIIRTARYVPPMLMRGAAVENDLACRILGRCAYGPPIDREVGAMIPAEPTSRHFVYARYDVGLSPEGLKALGVSLSCEKLVMDNVRALPDFVRIGEAAAQQVDMPTHFPQFVTGEDNP